MRRRRQTAPPPESSSSSDDDDAFAAFSRKKKKRKQKKSTSSIKVSTTLSGSDPAKVGKDPVSVKDINKSSISNNAAGTKRHHGASSARQAKMDALLLELENEEKKAASAAASSNSTPGHYGPGAAGPSSVSRPPPDKRGSFVEEGEEHLTTNIFVSNLAPSVTEEALTDLFRQFGDLYSVKIMWPRTAEERSRNRNTGFVCFMTRDDAQEAMDAYNEEVVFGRRIALRWGKNVKKTVKRGTGGVPIPPIRKKISKRIDDRIENAQIYGVDSIDISEPRQINDTNPFISAVPDKDTNRNNISQKKAATKIIAAQLPPYPIYDPLKHNASAVRVRLPSNLYRLQFITTVASFVAKDGSILEKKIIERESSNPLFSFLDSNSSNFTKVNEIWENLSKTEREQLHERVFYRWRVFAFTQGDGLNSWRTDPFLMFNNGQWWIPPALNQEAAQLEEELVKRKEDDIIKKMDERRRISNKKGFMTGRQLEHAKFGNVPRTNDGGGVKLNEWEREQFDTLLRKKLCASKDSICEAMSFCFDKSGAAVEIAETLKESLLENTSIISLDTRIARLFLLSDILFNSQQPGVRNAFRYRDSIEAMAPDVFLSLGNHGNGKAGRMTMNKLRQAVNGVLCAWSNWSVYNSNFIDELRSKFDGKEVKSTFNEEDKAQIAKNEDTSVKNDPEVQPNERTKNTESDRKPIAFWKVAEDECPPNDLDGEKLEDEEMKAVNNSVGFNLSIGIDWATKKSGNLDGESLEDGDEFYGDFFSDEEFARIAMAMPSN